STMFAYASTSDDTCTAGGEGEKSTWLTYFATVFRETRSWVAILRPGMPSASSVLIRSCIGIGIVKPFLLKFCGNYSRNCGRKTCRCRSHSAAAHTAHYEPLTWLSLGAHSAHKNLITHTYNFCQAARAVLT